MASLNSTIRRQAARTHNGAIVNELTPIVELRRSVMAAMMWESSFYESGSAHGLRVAGLIHKLVEDGRADEIAALAIEARERMYLRHVPLVLVAELAKIKGNGPLVAATLPRIILRPDELTEYLSIYWNGNASGNKKRPFPLSAGSKRGLGEAFRRFNAYSLAKYDQDKGVKLRDVLRLSHPRPTDTAQSDLWGHVVKRTLPTPDTWEVELSASTDKKASWERLLTDKRLGGLAFLRNLRNMEQAGVDRQLIIDRFNGNFERVLPFRFLAASRHAPSFAAQLSDGMLLSCQNLPKLPGRTVVLIDVSDSMNHKLSDKSEMRRMDAACAMAVIAREVCTDARVFSFSASLVEVKNYRGLPLADAIRDSQPHRSTYLGKAVAHLNELKCYDRLIVVTDEQSDDPVPAPLAEGSAYIINVAAYKNGVAWGDWTTISGWSERVLDFLYTLEGHSATGAAED